MVMSGTRRIGEVLQYTFKCILHTPGGAYTNLIYPTSLPLSVSVSVCLSASLSLVFRTCLTNFQNADILMASSPWVTEWKTYLRKKEEGRRKNEEVNIEY